MERYLIKVLCKYSIQYILFAAYRYASAAPVWSITLPLRVKEFQFALSILQGSKSEQICWFGEFNAVAK